VVNIGRAGMAGENVTQRVIMVKENEKAHRCDAAFRMRLPLWFTVVYCNTCRMRLYVHAICVCVGLAQAMSEIYSSARVGTGVLLCHHTSPSELVCVF
jgi:hypothetical protein